VHDEWWGKVGPATENKNAARAQSRTFGRRGGIEKEDRSGRWGKLLQAVRDARLIQIVWRHLHADAVPERKSDEALPHFAGNVGEHAMFVSELDPEHGSGEDGDNRAFGFDSLFGHKGMTAN
jgi:hypothetical protein